MDGVTAVSLVALAVLVLARVWASRVATQPTPDDRSAREALARAVQEGTLGRLTWQGDSRNEATR